MVSRPSLTLAHSDVHLVWVLGSAGVGSTAGGGATLSAGGRGGEGVGALLEDVYNPPSSRGQIDNDTPTTTRATPRKTGTNHEAPDPLISGVCWLSR